MFFKMFQKSSQNFSVIYLQIFMKSLNKFSKYFLKSSVTFLKFLQIFF